MEQLNTNIEKWNVKVEKWNIKVEKWNIKVEKWNIKVEKWNIKVEKWNTKLEKWNIKWTTSANKWTRYCCQIVLNSILMSLARFLMQAQTSSRSRGGCTTLMHVCIMHANPLYTLPLIVKMSFSRAVSYHLHPAFSISSLSSDPFMGTAPCSIEPLACYSLHAERACRFHVFFLLLQCDERLCAT